ncbi:hypothetical protein D3C80_1730860 [compost metagenome]
MGVSLFQLIHLGLRPCAPPCRHCAPKVGICGRMIAATEREAPREFMSQPIAGIEPRVPREPHRFFILLERNAVHAVKADNLRIHQGLFVGECAWINARPKRDLVVVLLQPAPVLDGEGLRRQLSG